MIRSVTLALAATAALAGGAGAIEYPAPGPDDPNMRVAVYRPSQRYLIVGRLRHETTITFGKAETVTRVAFGDPDAWEGQKSEIRPKNSITIWPLRTDLTNMTVMTETPDGSERVYHFALVAHDPNITAASASPCPEQLQAASATCSAVRQEDRSAIYGLTFTYPDEVRTAANQAAQARREQEDARRARDRAKVDVFYGQRNWAYIARGDARLRPLEVSDNRRLTGFRYPGTLALPAFFWLGPDGAERSLSYDMTDDVAVTKLRARVFRLRQGNAVTEVFNCDGLGGEACVSAASDAEAFARIPFADPGPDPRTGTTSPDVIREVRTTTLPSRR